MTDSENDAIYPVGPGAGGGPVQAERLLLAMERMPAQPSIALRVVWACEDPRSDARTIADAMAVDPVLVARVLRVANSAFYGIRSEISGLGRAVTVVGLATIRAVATTAAANIGGVVPQGFWEHAAAVGTACQLVAHRFGVPPNDAFSAGLLHDLGSALLHIAVPDGWEEVERSGRGSLAEIAAFGITHDEAAARVLTAWRLPASLCEAIGRHTKPFSSSEPPMTKAVIVGEAIAAAAGHGSCVCPDHEHGFDTGLLLDMSGLEAASLDRLVERVDAESRSLAAVLAPNQ